MQTTEMNPEAILAAAAAIPEDAPVVMLNLLRYRAQADYGGHPDSAAGSGREIYFGHYVPAFNAVAALKEVQTSIVYVGTALAGLVAPPDERWDDIALVEYPSLAAFRSIAESREYQAQASHHRRAALQDWRLIATVKMPFG